MSGMRPTEDGREERMDREGTIAAVEPDPRRKGMYRVHVLVRGVLGEAGAEEKAETEDGTARASRQKPADGPAAKTAPMEAEEVREASFLVHEDTVVELRLLVGKRLSASELAMLSRAQEAAEAYRTALAMLDRKARTARELAAALKRKGYAAESIAASLDKLKLLRFIDDEAFAKRFAEQRIASQRKGRLLVRQELLQKGIGRPEADAALGEIDPEAERSAAEAFARKRWPGVQGATHAERRRKLTAMLLRRGFPNAVAREAVRKASAEAEDGGGTAGETDWEAGDDGF